MGAWAEGNFDNDAALDLVSDFTKLAVQEMRPPEEVEDIDLLMGAVAVHKALVEHCHAAPPDLDQLTTLKDAVLELYDDEIDSLEPAEDYKDARRAVIEKTFADFIALVEKSA